MKFPPKCIPQYHSPTHSHSAMSSLPAGIVRDSSCIKVPAWQAWKCYALSHRMMVIESMDSDTEVRRLSPIALIANPGEARRQRSGLSLVPLSACCLQVLQTPGN